MVVEISYDDDHHPRHERLEWMTEVYPVDIQIVRHLGYPKTEMGNVVLTASRYPGTEMAGPTAPLPRLGTATTAQLLDELEARLQMNQDHPSQAAWALVREARRCLTPELLNYRTVDDG